MSIIDIYYYTFYKFYKLFEKFEQTRWLTKEKAAICIGTLEVGIYFSLINYKDVLLQRNSSFDDYSFIVISIIIFLKWVAFFKDEKWRDYLVLFDSWPKNKNLKGSWLVFIVTVIIVGNFIISCVLFSPLRG